MDGVFEQTFGGEVLSKRARREIAVRQFFLPVGVVFDRVAVDGFVFAAVNAEVGLAVAVEIEGAEGDGA